MLHKLDPHSNYIPAKDLKAINESIEGKFGGVGIRFFIIRDTICITNIIAGSPSQAAGFKAGDKNISLGDINKVRDMLVTLKGRKGTAGGFNIENFTRRELWDKFKSNARKQLSGNDVHDFNEFIKAFEAGAEARGTTWNARLSEIFDDGLPAVKGSGDEELINTKKILEKGMDYYNNGIKKFLTSEMYIMKGIGVLLLAGQKLVNILITGFYKSPKELQLALIKKGYKGKTVLSELTKSLFASKILLPVLVALGTAFYYGKLRLDGIKNELRSKYGSGWDYFFEEIIINPTMSGIKDIGPMSLLFKDNPSWADFAKRTFPGFVDDSIISFFTTVKASGEEGGQTPEEIKNDTAVGELNDKLKNDFSKKDKQLIEDESGLTAIKIMVGNILDKKNADFIKSRLEYIPEIPKDYLTRVNEKLKEAGSDVEINNLTDIKSALSTKDSETIKNIGLYGTSVLKGKSGDKYIVLGKNRNNPSITMDVFTNDFTEEIMWVKPSFNDLTLNSTRDYYTLKEFIKQYNNL
jgi:hypothetical protein